MKQQLWAVASLAVAWLASGQTTSSWVSATSGQWTNPASWTGGLPGPGIDASINVDGTYTATLRTTGTVQNVWLGNTTASGTQTLVIDSTTSSYLNFTNLTIGSRGILAYSDNSYFYGTGLVTVASGGQLYRSASKFNGSLADHDLWVQPGGRWTVNGGATHTVQPAAGSRDVSCTIDGTLDGAGTIDFNNNQGGRVWIGGTGQVSIAAITLNKDNGNLYFCGALTVNSPIIQSNANQSSTVLSNGTLLTLNGPYYVQNTGNALLCFTNTDSATVTGTNLISLLHDGNGSYGNLTGAKVGAAGGALTIAGTGLLDICQASTVYSFRFNGAVLNILRNAHFWSPTNTAQPILPTGSFAMNLSSNTLTLDTNCVLRLHRGSTTTLNVTNYATLGMRQAVLEGNTSSSSYSLNVGRGTPGTLKLQGATNIFRRSSDNSVANYPLCAHLGTNAVISPDPGNVLRVQDCYLAIGITNPASWGWKKQGAVELYSNATFEAMNMDRGSNILFETVGFGIRDFRLSAPPVVNVMTVALWNAGSPFNDQNGTTDTVLYVRSLDISGFSGTTIVLSNGTGVVAGKQKI